jgi:hypothetical protein
MCELNRNVGTEVSHAMYWTEKAKEAAAEILVACQNPPSLIDHLARLVARKRRSGVTSDTWSYRNQLIVVLHGFSQARGYKDWLKVGRKVQKGQKAFYVMAPLLVTKAQDPGQQPTTKGKKKTGKKEPDTEKKKVLVGWRAVAVFGLEQTEALEDRRAERKHMPLEDDASEETVSVFHGYKQPWYEWYARLRPEVEDKLTAQIGAAIVAKLRDEATELQDLLNVLAKHPGEDIAERIDASCRAVAEFLGAEPALSSHARS